MWTAVLIGAIALALGLVVRSREAAASSVTLTRRALWLRAGRVLLDAVLVACLAHVVLGLPAIKQMMREQMDRVVAYPEQFRSARFLSERFSRSDREAFRLALTRSLARRSAVEAEASTLYERVFPVLDGSMREDLRDERQQWIVPADEVRGRHAHLRVRQRTMFTEYGDSATVPLHVDMDPMPGWSEAALCSLSVLKIDDVPVVPLPQLSIGRSASGQITFDGRRRIATRNGKVRFEWVTVKHIPLDDKWISLVAAPTRGATIRFQFVDADHPSPSLYLFGLDQPDPGGMELADSSAGMREWRYSGWLFKRNGWVVTWPAREAPEEPTAARSDVRAANRRAVR